MRNKSKHILAMMLAVMMLLAMATSAMATGYYSGTLNIGGRVKITSEPVQMPTPAPEAGEQTEATDAPQAEMTPAVTPEATAEPTPAPETTPDASQEPVVQPKTGVVYKKGEDNVAMIREKPTSDSPRVGKAYHGDIVTALAQEGSWYEVEVNGVHGWMHGGMISFDPAMIAEAQEEEVAVEPTAEATVEPSVEPATEATVEPSAESSTTAVITYERDAEGNLVLDANGDPIAIVPEGAEIPADYLRDENGALVLDENGNPIVTVMLPAGSNVITSIYDQLDPNRRIDIYVSVGEGELAFGVEAKLIAVAIGYDMVEYSLQWQTSSDNVNWQDVAGATQPELAVQVTEENYLDYWRVLVIIDEQQ